MHFGCLKSWITSKVVVKDHGNTITYDAKRFECEVCEKPYPKCIFFNNKRYDIFLNLPNPPYLLLENIIREKKKSRGVILMKMNKDNTTQELNEIKMVHFYKIIIIFLNK